MVIALCICCACLNCAVEAARRRRTDRIDEEIDREEAEAREQRRQERRLRTHLVQGEVCEDDSLSDASSCANEKADVGMPGDQRRASVLSLSLASEGDARIGE